MEEKQSEVLEILKKIVTAIVDDKADVTLSGAQSGTTYAISMRVSDRDAGKVIGKAGRTMDAIRLIAAAIGGKDFRPIIILDNSQ